MQSIKYVLLEVISYFTFSYFNYDRTSKKKSQFIIHLPHKPISISTGLIWQQSETGIESEWNVPVITSVTSM